VIVGGIAAILSRRQVVRGRKRTVLNQLAPHGQFLRMIHHQHVNCGSANGGSTFDQGSVPSKVFRPEIQPRMKESFHRAGQWINPRKVGTFVAVTSRAAQSQILRLALPVMLLGDDVVNRKSQAPGGLRHVAVLAPVCRSFAHTSIDPPCDHRDWSVEPRSERSAFIRMIDSKLSM
jgi:hypothetical protein